MADERIAIRRRLRVAILAGAAVLTFVAGCGENPPSDNAVDAREQNVVERDGVRYRVVLFRELNPYAPPDESVWTGRPPAKRSALYMAVVRACGVGDARARTTGEIHLENAFGQRFEARAGDTARAYAYRPGVVGPGECLPREGSAADATLGGAALVFDVPIDAVRERPMVLVVEDARIQLDL